MQNGDEIYLKKQPEGEQSRLSKPAPHGFVVLRADQHGNVVKTDDLGATTYFHDNLPTSSSSSSSSS